MPAPRDFHSTLPVMRSAHQTMPRSSESPYKIVAHEHDAAVFVGELGFEWVDGFDFDVAIGAGDLFQEGSAAVVAGVEEDEVIADDGGGNDGGGFVDVERPEEFAVVRADAHRTAAC